MFYETEQLPNYPGCQKRPIEVPFLSHTLLHFLWYQSLRLMTQSYIIKIYNWRGFSVK